MVRRRNDFSALSKQEEQLAETVFKAWLNNLKSQEANSLENLAIFSSQANVFRGFELPGNIYLKWAEREAYFLEMKLLLCEKELKKNMSTIQSRRMLTSLISFFVVTFTALALYALVYGEKKAWGSIALLFASSAALLVTMHKNIENKLDFILGRTPLLGECKDENLRSYVKNKLTYTHSVNELHHMEAFIAELKGEFPSTTEMRKMR